MYGNAYLNIWFFYIWIFYCYLTCEIYSNLDSCKCFIILYPYLLNNCWYNNPIETPKNFHFCALRDFFHGLKLTQYLMLLHLHLTWVLKSMPMLIRHSYPSKNEYIGCQGNILCFYMTIIWFLWFMFCNQCNNYMIGITHSVSTYLFRSFILLL